MVSFSCPRCGDVVKKPKVLSHAQMCGVDHLSCIDCMEVFDLESIKQHNACVSEVEKYQGKWMNKNSSGNAKRSAADSDDEHEDKRKASKLVRPPTFSFDALQSSSSDDDDWVTSSKAKAATTTNRNTSTTKRAREERESGAGQQSPKKQRRETPKGSSASSKMGRSPLVLPQSTEEESRRADVHVGAFALGNDETLRGVMDGILGGGESLSEKELARHLAEAYEKRVVKQFRQCVRQLIQQKRIIKEDRSGNIRLI